MSFIPMVNVPPCYDFVQLADRTIIVTGFFTYRHRLFWTTRITSGFLIQKIPPVQKNRGWWFMSTGFVTWFDFCTHLPMNGASKTQTVIFHRSFHQSFVVCKWAIYFTYGNDFQWFKESRSRRIYCVLEGLGNLLTSTKPPIFVGAEMGGFCNLYVQKHCLLLLLVR